MEEWRIKAIEYLKRTFDPKVANAIKALKDGKGYLTHEHPIRVVFFEDME